MRPDRAHVGPATLDPRCHPEVRPHPRPRRRRRLPVPWHAMAEPAHASSSDVFVDLSDNNDGFDAREYAAAGHLLVAIKATQGTGDVDERWADWADQAHDARLGVAHYHFCAVAGDPLAEAWHFWETVRPRFRKATDRLVLDLEIGDQGAWPQYLRSFDSELYRYSTVKAIGYTFASADLAQLQLHSRAWWLASWGTDQPSGFHRSLPGRQALWGWQYYGGTVDPSGGPTASAGAPGTVDHSVLAPAIVRNLQKALRR